MKVSNANAKTITIELSVLAKSLQNCDLSSPLSIHQQEVHQQHECKTAIHEWRVCKSLCQHHSTQPHSTSLYPNWITTSISSLTFCGRDILSPVRRHLAPANYMQKKTIAILKLTCLFPDESINKCNEVHGACRYNPDFHRLENSAQINDDNIAADESVNWFFKIKFKLIRRQWQ